MTTTGIHRALGMARAQENRSRGAHASQRGQILVMFALMFGTFLLSLFAMVVDVAVIYVDSTRAQSAAEVAAQTGAQDINPKGIFYSQAPVLAADYATVCEASAQDSAVVTSGVHAVCGAVGSLAVQSLGCPNPFGASVVNTVEACVTITVPLPIQLFLPKVTVRGSFEAAPVAGTTVPVTG